MSYVPPIYQVVLFGAGMDTRAFRLKWSKKTHVYEVDRPENSAKKELILKQVSAKCTRSVIEYDFTQDWITKLINKGYRPDLPSIWLLEGLLMYLSEWEVYQLLTKIWDLTAKGSWLGASLLNACAPHSHEFSAKYWSSGFNSPEDLLTAIGWDVNIVWYGQWGEIYGRVTQQDLSPEVIVWYGQWKTKFNSFKQKTLAREASDIFRSFWIRAKKSK